MMIQVKMISTNQQYAHPLFNPLIKQTPIIRAGYSISRVFIAANCSIDGQIAMKQT